MGNSQGTGADISAIITCIVPSAGNTYGLTSPQRDHVPSMARIPCKSSCVLFFQSHTASLEIQKFKKRVLQGLVYDIETLEVIDDRNFDIGVDIGQVVFRHVDFIVVVVAQ